VREPKEPEAAKSGNSPRPTQRRRDKKAVGMGFCSWYLRLAIAQQKNYFILQAFNPLRPLFDRFVQFAMIMAIALSTGQSTSGAARRIRSVSG